MKTQYLVLAKHDFVLAQSLFNDADLFKVVQGINAVGEQVEVEKVLYKVISSHDTEGPANDIKNILVKATAPSESTFEAMEATGVIVSKLSVDEMLARPDRSNIRLYVYFNQLIKSKKNQNTNIKLWKTDSTMQ